MKVKYSSWDRAWYIIGCVITLSGLYWARVFLTECIRQAFTNSNDVKEEPFRVW